MDSNRKVILRFKEDLKRFGIHPQKVILFGSRARGDNLRNSDYDVIVISEKFEGQKFPRRLMDIEEAWTGVEPIEALGYTPAEYERMKKRSYVVSGANKEGVVI